MPKIGPEIFFSSLWISFYKRITPFLITLSYNALLCMLNQRVYDSI